MSKVLFGIVAIYQVGYGFKGKKYKRKNILQLI